MSVKIMGLVWDEDLPKEEKFVLLAYADHADHDGGNIYPAVVTIARKTGYSERSVQRLTRSLEDRGYLIPEGGQSGGRNVTAKWRIPIKGDRLSPIQKGDIHDTKRVTSTTERVTSTTLKGDIAMSPESSLTVIKPSVVKTSKNEPIFRQLFDAFLEESGISETMIVNKGNIDEINKWEKEGFTPEEIRTAVRELQKKNFAIVRPASITNALIVVRSRSKKCEDPMKGYTPV